MIGKIIEQDAPALVRRIQRLEAEISDLQSERRSRSSTVSGGDLVIEGGGNVRVKDGGNIFVSVLGRIFAFGATSRSHMADGFLWVEALLNPANPEAGGGPPFSLIKPGYIQLAAADPTKTAVIQIQADGSLTMNPSNNQVGVGHNTTSSSANTVMDVFGVLMRSTSSKRYKRDITNIDVDPAAVLKMRPKTWRDRRDVDADPDTTKHYVGFIAEDLHDLGLTEFVAYDDEGRPDAIAYDRLAVALLAVVQQQEKRLTALESTTEKHGGLLAKITGALTGLLPKGTL